MSGGNGRRKGNGKDREREQQARTDDFILALYAAIASRRAKLGAAYWDMTQTAKQAVAAALGCARGRIDDLVVSVEDGAYQRLYRWTSHERNLARQIISAVDPGSRYRVAIIRTIAHAFGVREEELINQTNNAAPPQPTKQPPTAHA